MIEQVEPLDLQLHIQSVKWLKRSPDAKIPLHLGESTEKIARRVSRQGRFTTIRTAVTANSHSRLLKS
jgi:hypothetical protein